ncbi:hypothetical protein BsWGS_21647 [Bradybaena similaris]
MTDNNGVMTHNNRVMTDNNGELTGNNGEVTDNKGEVTDNNGKVTDNKGEVTDNNGEVTDNIGEVWVSKSMAGLTAAEDRKQPSDDVQTRQQSGTVMETSFTTKEVPQPEVVVSEADLRRGEEVSLRAHLCSLWYLAVVVLTPILLLPIIFSVDEQFQRPARCGYTIAVMAVYWTSECLPIAVTSLLPIVLLPALGVMSARNTSASYFNDTSMLFVGGLLVAIAIEVWDVHKRIALLVLRLVGAEPRCLLLGITLVTWFLSMWISNTATAAMMMTIVHALLQQFKDFHKVPAIDVSSGSISSSNETVVRQTAGHDVETARQQQERKSEAEFLRLGKALSLTVAYAANIGGIASLTGTGPNLVFFAAAQRIFEDVGLHSPVSFSSWLVYGLPLSLLLVVVMWLWMVTIYLRCRGNCSCCSCGSSCRSCGSWGSCGSRSNDEQVQKVNGKIADEYHKLGPITYAQGTVLVLFLTLILTWITRDLGGVAGWGRWFPASYVSDSTPSLLFGILMFVLPSSFPSSIINRCATTARYRRVGPLLTWKQIHEKMPWSLYLLLGGGYALARAATDSGLSAWLGGQLLVFRGLNHWLILLIICYIITFLTEVTSNTAIATLMMPILSQMAISLQLNPLFLMFPAAITTSFAFMLPVATPPNAIVFSHGIVRVVDMVLSGLFLNCISVPILLFATATWGNAFFKFDQLPPEFAHNTTSVSVRI